MARGCRQQSREEESSRDVHRVPASVQLSFDQCTQVRKLPGAGERRSQMHLREKTSELMQG